MGEWRYTLSAALTLDSCLAYSSALKVFDPHFYLQTVQMQVHLANGVMGGEADMFLCNVG
jgi:hypothetical protein